MKKLFEYNEIESLALFIRRLNYEADSGALVIVEGQRDTNALRSLGFEGELFLLCQNKSFTKLITTALSYKKVIVLFDLDTKGDSLTKKVVLLLQKDTIIDLHFRRELLKATRGKVRHIEELNRYVEYLQTPIEKLHIFHPTSANNK